MAITQISNNVILDGTILPAKLNVSASMRTFLGNATSANLASAVSGTTGSGNLVFGTSPTIATPTFTGDVTSNVGTGRMLVNKTSSSGVREEIFRATVSDASSDFFFIANGTISDSQFRPVFAGMQNTVSTGWSLGFSGYVTAANDASDSSPYGVVDFSVLRSTSTSDPSNGGLSDVVNRKAFTFRSLSTTYMTIAASGNVGIGTTTPNVRSILDLTSTTKGFLPPRMTETERNAITSVPAALLVYNSTANAISLYNGTAWGEVLTTHAASFTSDTLRNAVSDETGTGNLVFSTNPTFQGANVTGNLAVTAHFSAATKSFKIPHQTKGGYLQYGVVESNEHSVYVRGSTSDNVIHLPDHWLWLVDADSVTVTLTPVEKFQPLFVESSDNKKVIVGGVEGRYNYVIYGTRKDVEPLQIEIE